MNELFVKYIDTTAGLIELTASDKGLITAEFVETEYYEKGRSNPVLEKTALQLKEYFSGRRKIFNIPLDWQGTQFQQRVWRYLLTIPYGRTVSYAEIARAIGDIKSVRAVGTASGKNNIAVIVPCHRVIGTNGDLTGYAYGIWRKEFLLNLEGALIQKEEQMDLF